MVIADLKVNAHMNRKSIESHTNFISRGSGRLEHNGGMAPGAG